MSALPILLGTAGVVVVVIVLVAVLFPLILDRSPLGDVVFEAELDETLKALDTAERALSDLLRVTGAASFEVLFDGSQPFYLDTVSETVAQHTEWASALLDEAQRSALPLNPEYAEKLPAGTLALPPDAWRNPIRVYFGPWTAGRHGVDAPPFLSYYDGNLKPVIGGVAPEADAALYVYSHGRDGMTGQPHGQAMNDSLAADDVGGWVR